MKIAVDFAAGEKNNREELFVADCGGVLAGCIMLCRTDDPLSDAIRQYEQLAFKAVASVENITWDTSGKTLSEIKMELSL